MNCQRYSVAVRVGLPDFPQQNTGDFCASVHPRQGPPNHIPTMCLYNYITYIAHSQPNLNFKLNCVRGENKPARYCCFATITLKLEVTYIF